MKNRIIEICELGQPKSMIVRENEPISELIKTTDLVEELNKQLLLHNVVGQSEQLPNSHCGYDRNKCLKQSACKYPNCDT